MTLVVRRRAAVLVPWLALVAVTVFAVIQMRARHAAEQDAPSVAVEAKAPVEPAARPASPEVVGAAHAAEAALDAALQDLETARAKAVALERECLAGRSRAAGAEARLAAAAARAAALETEVEALRTAATEAIAAPAEAEPPTEEPADDLAAWVEDATSDDRQRRLRAAEKSGDLTDDAVIAALLGTDTEPARTIRLVIVLGSEALLRPAVLDALLGRAAPFVLDVALGHLSGREEKLGDAERRAELAALLAPRLGSDDPAELHAAACAVGLLRLPGLAERLAALLAHDAKDVRVVAAHGLSLVPDLDTVRADAVKALPKILLDDAPAVRIAGVLLAERLVGAPIDYDPAAGEGARREALDRILDRLE